MLHPFKHISRQDYSYQLALYELVCPHCGFTAIAVAEFVPTSCLYGENGCLDDREKTRFITTWLDPGLALPTPTPPI